MNSENTYYFRALKQAVATTFLLRHEVSSEIETWKGEDIVLFQEDLFAKVKAKVSEKWFYTYFKNEAEKLPRIDMLNLLSEYVGFKNWNAFKAAQNFKQPKKMNPIILWLLILLPILLVVLLNIMSPNEFHFCFIDGIKNEPITKITLDLKLLQDEESPLYFKTDSTGCFSYKTKDQRIKFVVQSPFHKTDTIVRHIDNNTNKTIELATDDYALMLHYFTNGNITDWKKHKSQLEELIANDAKIYRLFDENIGVELFTKDEFIRTLTLPTSNLQRIKILDKTFEGNRIVSLKFIIR